MLKIDIRFVRGLGVDRACDAVVRAVLSLGETLGLSVVAEGVETPAQADLLRSYGCDTGQGYLYSTPRPEAEILDYLAEAGLADATRADRGREKPQRRPLRTVPR
jgi:EAL domain-containing protein (putative c-di-GMP-specific phosphodiesterase class I)